MFFHRSIPPLSENVTMDPSVSFFPPISLVPTDMDGRVSLCFCLLKTDVCSGAPWTQVFNGSLILQMQGNEDSAGFRSFNDSWAVGRGDDVFESYVRSKLPCSLREYDWFNVSAENMFGDPDAATRAFAYDAVTALGIAMCTAGENTAYFTGPEVRGQFGLNFSGASGQVEINNTTGTRKSVPFMAFNARLEGAGVVVDRVYSYDNGWTRLGGTKLFYANGKSTPGPDLPEVDFDYNYIGGLRWLPYSLLIIALLCSMLSFVWLSRNRRSKVVQAAHPLFLFMITLGNCILALAIIPLSIDEESVNGKPPVVVCMSAPWLATVGFSLVVSSLLAKARSVYQVWRRCRCME
jgi:7 transmembrane sweet-taste receptor of 3 GCPR